MRLAGEDARHVGEQVFLVAPAGAPVVEVADYRRVAGQRFLEVDPDLAEGEPLLPLLIDSPPVRVPDAAVSAQRRLDEILVLVEQVQQRYEFPALPNPVAFAISMNNSLNSSSAPTLVRSGYRM